MECMQTKNVVWIQLKVEMERKTRREREREREREKGGWGSHKTSTSEPRWVKPGLEC